MLTNTGTMIGDILLSLGQDTYDWRGSSGDGTVYCGGGNDRFIGNALADCGGKIVDFSAGAGNNDVVWIRALAFGGGLVAGALDLSQFQTSADTVAPSATLRFICDTTDTTLWFDANGSAAGGLILLADL